MYNVGIKKLKDNHVTFRLEPTESPVCHMAVFLDLDGNQLMIHKEENARIRSYKIYTRMKSRN